MPAWAPPSLDVDVDVIDFVASAGLTLALSSLTAFTLSMLAGGLIVGMYITTALGLDDE